MRKRLVTPRKTYTLTTTEAVAVLAVFVALAIAYVVWASTWSTHTLALVAVVLLVFRAGPSK